MSTKPGQHPVARRHAADHERQTARFLTLSNLALGSAVLCLALIVGCINTQTVALNESFNLGIGKTLQLSDSGFSIKFIGVKHDGRCPRGVQCIWQGDAAVQFDVKSNGSSQSITLHTAGGGDMPGSIEVLGRTVSLLGLTPYLQSGITTAPKAYVAALSVS